MEDSLKLEDLECFEFSFMQHIPEHLFRRQILTLNIGKPLLNNRITHIVGNNLHFPLILLRRLLLNLAHELFPNLQFPKMPEELASLLLHHHMGGETPLYLCYLLHKVLYAPLQLLLLKVVVEELHHRLLSSLIVKRGRTRFAHTLVAKHVADAVVEATAACFEVEVCDALIGEDFSVLLFQIGELKLNFSAVLIDD